MMECDIEQYLAKFDPYRGDGGWVTEDPSAYATRMQNSLLPHWPTEVLIEWLHRHAGHIRDHAFLRFETFKFEKETWPIEMVPGRESFADPTFFDNFENVEERAKYSNDWLASFMLQNGTWNTPVVFLRTSSEDLIADRGWPLRFPYHLLEGHRRSSFLGGLKRLGKAIDTHDVWIVRSKNA
jgi:hypothetical protein